MDITVFPRELLYKDKKNFEDFDINIDNSLNALVYRKLSYFLRYSIKITLKESDYIEMYNDANYFCVLVYLDHDPAGHIRDIIEVVFKNIKRQSEELDLYKRLVLTIVRAYLSTAFKNRDGIIPIKKYLNDKTYFIHGLSNKVEKGYSISIDVFKPRIITKGVVSGISWSEITDNFKLKNIHYCINNLGSSNEEKLLIISSIYKAEILSDSIYTIPYEVDRYLSDRYREFKGGELGCYIQNKVSKPDNENTFIHIFIDKCDYKSDIKLSRLSDLYKKTFKENIFADTDKLKLDFQNMCLISENKSLQSSLSELQEKYSQLKIKYESQLADRSNQTEIINENDSLKRKEAEMQAQIIEMNSIIQDLQKKLGDETVPLTVIVEGIKRKARWGGLPAANLLFDQIDVLLYEVETWRNNRIELLSFFEELANPHPQVNVVIQSGGMAQISENDIINTKQLPNNTSNYENKD